MGKCSGVNVITNVLCFVCIILSALFFNVGFSTEDRFFVEGKVYCDTCRVQFVTRISEFMKGAEVKLECRNPDTESVTYSNHAVTDETGSYRLPVDGDHEEEICDVFLVESSRNDCNEVAKGFVKQTAMIGLTSNNGLSSPVRQASPLGFLIKSPLPKCPEVLRELGFVFTGVLA